MRTAPLLVFLVSLSLPAAAFAETAGFGQPFNQQQQEQLQQQQLLQQLQQQQLQQQQLQQQQQYQQQYQQPQQYPAQQQYQDPQQQQLQQQQLQQQQLQQQQLQQQQLQQQQLQQQLQQQQLQQQQLQYQQPQQYPAQQQQYQQPQQYQPQQQMQPAGGGPCTVALSKDRSTIHLMDPAGTERKHISLGEDRVQKVFSSPDGAWSVAIYKIRGAPQYGFIALDLAKCEEQLPVDVPSVASAAAFDQGEVMLTFETGEKRFRLKNQVIQ